LFGFEDEFYACPETVVILLPNSKSSIKLKMPFRIYNDFIEIAFPKMNWATVSLLFSDISKDGWNVKPKFYRVATWQLWILTMFFNNSLSLILPAFLFGLIF
jgi:hypothetical protein